MYKFILSGLLMIASLPLVFCQENTTRLLNQLNLAIGTTQKYDDEKLRSIQALNQSLQEKINGGPSVLFTGYLDLFEEYKVFKHDSAYKYARELQQTAIKIGDPAKIVSARLKLGFSLLSSGMFKETLDSLRQIDITGAPDSLRADYFALYGRFYYDLGDFDNDTYNTPHYTEKGNAYMDSALRLFPPGSFQYSYYRGLQALKTGNNTLAVEDFKQLMNRPNLSWHEIAVTASTLSYIYIQKDSTDTAISLLVRAAIADIKSSTKETAAMFDLAQILYKQGDVRNASSYIEAAIRDASFYGARQRKVQVSAILPLIEAEKVSRVESQRKKLVTYAVISTVLLLLVIALAIIIFRQVSKLKIAGKVITDAHIRDQAINQRLSDTNNKLSEANQIKEEYIGYFFNTNSEFFTKLEKFKKSLEQKIAYRKWEDVIGVVNNINLKKEKEDLLQNFDKAFLKLFPDFIAGFNALFREEDKIVLKDHEFLNTDLRIFALIRMGIHENEKIARILEYSVNTINTYKTKIKNKSVVPNEEFEQRIMEIRTL